MLSPEDCTALAKVVAARCAPYRNVTIKLVLAGPAGLCFQIGQLLAAHKFDFKSPRVSRVLLKPPDNSVGRSNLSPKPARQLPDMEATWPSLSRSLSAAPRTAASPCSCSSCATGCCTPAQSGSSKDVPMVRAVGLARPTRPWLAACA